MNTLRHALAWLTIAGGALLAITCHSPLIGLLGLTLCACGAAMLMDD